jgi:major vault protein
MYLPDPRTEVVVKRKLSAKECELMYPNNKEVLKYNTGLDIEEIKNIPITVNASSIVGSSAANSVIDSSMLNSPLAVNKDRIVTLVNNFNAGTDLSRKTTYTKPRTITLDNKFDGVVTIDVWTGYAINIVSKSGKREVVQGPTTRLLDYDESIEAMELSTGKPKTTDNLFRTGFLRIENNKIADIINAQTSDFVDVSIKLSYCVNFLEEYKDKWFNVENYVKYLCDHMRAMIKKEVKKYTIQDFYNNSIDIVREIVLNSSDSTTIGRTFTENGMCVYDVDVLSVKMDDYYKNIFDRHQEEMVRKTLELTNAQVQYKITEELTDFNIKQAKLKHEQDLIASELAYKRHEDEMAKDEAIKEKERAAQEAAAQAKYDLQEVLTAIQAEELNRITAQNDIEIEHAKKLAEIEKAKQESYARTVKTIIDSIGPDLVAALTSKANSDLLAAATVNMSPYSIAQGESVADTINTLLRGTSLEGVIDNITN